MKHLLILMLALGMSSLSPVYAQNDGEDTESSTRIVVAGDEIDEKSAEEIAAAIREVKDEIVNEWRNLPEEEREALLTTLKDGIKVNVDSQNLENAAGSAAAVAVFAIMFTFGFPILMVGLILYASHRKRRQKAELIAKFVENGQEVPKEILAEIAPYQGPNGNMERGVRGMGIGVALFLFLGFLVDWSVAAIGFIPFFIGLARVVIWLLNKPQAEQQPASKATANVATAPSHEQDN